MVEDQENSKKRSDFLGKMMPDIWCETCETYTENRLEDGQIICVCCENEVSVVRELDTSERDNSVYFLE